MANKIRDNRDGTISIVDENDNEVSRFEKGSGDQISGEGLGPGGAKSVGAKGGRGDIPERSIDGVSEFRGGSRDDARRTPQTPNEPRAGVIDHNEVNRILGEFGEIIRTGGNAEAQAISIRQALVRAGFSSQEAESAMAEVVRRPDAFPLGGFGVDQATRNQSRSQGEQDALLAANVRGQLPTVNAGETSAQAQERIAAARASEKERLELQETQRQAEFTPFDKFLFDAGIDPQTAGLDAIIPQGREAFRSSTETGRNQLFGNFLNTQVPIGGPGILRDILGSFGNRFDDAFELSQALGRTAPVDVEFKGEQFNLGNSFTQFLNRPNPLGTFGGNFDEFLQLASGDPNQLAATNKTAFQLRQDLVDNPSLAFDFIQSQGNEPVFGNFGAANRARRNIFDRAVQANPNLSGIDFLNMFQQGGFESFLGAR